MTAPATKAPKTENKIPTTSVNQLAVSTMSRMMSYAPSGASARFDSARGVHLLPAWRAAGR